MLLQLIGRADALRTLLKGDKNVATSYYGVAMRVHDCIQGKVKRSDCSM
jgi:hypothetical protein